MKMGIQMFLLILDSRAYSAEVKPSGYEGRIRSGMTFARNAFGCHAAYEA